MSHPLNSRFSQFLSLLQTWMEPRLSIRMRTWELLNPQILIKIILIHRCPTRTKTNKIKEIVLLLSPTKKVLWIKMVSSSNRKPRRWNRGNWNSRAHSKVSLSMEKGREIRFLNLLLSKERRWNWFHNRSTRPFSNKTKTSLLRPSLGIEEESTSLSKLSQPRSKPIHASSSGSNKKCSWWQPTTMTTIGYLRLRMLLLNF